MNMFEFVNSRPVRMTDPSGLWPKRHHDKIIDGLTSVPPYVKGLLKAASEEVDTRAGAQDPENSYQHSMRGRWMKWNWEFYVESVQEAKWRRDRWLEDNMRRALEELRNGDENEAWRLIGHSGHAIMDATSPTHEGFQLWQGFDDLVAALFHFVGEQYMSTARYNAAVFDYDQYINKFLRRAQDELGRTPEGTSPPPPDPPAGPLQAEPDHIDVPASAGGCW